MSTRCQIGFYRSDLKAFTDFESLVYRHSDGYPGGVLPDLLPILEDFDKNRGLDDIEYAAAWVVAKLKTDYLNIGISKGIHGDIDYFYAVYPDKLVVHSVGFGKGWNGLKEERTVPYKWKKKK